MSKLFAFNNAADMTAHPVPAGHYDAAQQLWVVDEASYANEIAPEIGKTTMSTLGVTGDPSNYDYIYDLAID